MEYTIEEISKEILLRLGYKLKNNNTKQMVSCKLHKDEHPSMSINLELGLFRCFSCGNQGSLKTLYYREFGRSIYRDMGIQRTDIPLSKRIDFSSVDYNKTPETDFIFEGQLVPLSSLDAGSNWIESRGFDEKLLNNLSIKYAKFGVTKKKSNYKDKDNWTYLTGRAIIPIYEKGTLISIEARDIFGQDHWKQELIKNGLVPEEHSYRKVLYPKGSSVNSLYQLDKLDNNKTVYVTEGLMDVISLRSNELFQNSTSTFGVNITERQYFLLKKFEKICFIPNNDLPGLTILRKLKEKNINCNVLLLPKTVKDVNDILQKKDKRFNTINDLIKKFNWLNNEKQLKDLNLDVLINSI